MTAIAARTFHWQSSVCQIWSVTRFYEGERDLKRIINKREQQGEKGLWRVEIWLLLFAPRWPLAYLPASSPTSFGSVGLLIDLVLYRVIACFICEKIWFAAWCARFFSKERGRGCISKFKIFDKKKVFLVVPTSQNKLQRENLRGG